MKAIARFTAVTAVVFLVGGCAATGGSQRASSNGPLPPDARKTTVEVENHNWSDMVVYAVRYTSRVRLGMVTSMEKREFKVPSSFSLGVGGLELVAEAIGSRERYLTGPINLNQGQRVELRLENQLPISTWSVW
ncbi:MAG: hypothetical protein GEU90_16065 [Gemmatimonas sp.]|nr:hypothetical protein [Gemmatimonas sp.]